MKRPLPISNCRSASGAPAAALHASRLTHHSSRATLRAFTLVEILVTIALLAFIIVGLFAAFNQVQRAFKAGMSQVDRLESGRAVTELLPREIEQIIAAGAPNVSAANFYAQALNSAPLIQSLPGTSIVRTNLLEDCFMLLRQNQTWVGIGYCVRTNDANGRLWLPETSSGQLGVGTLYRFSAPLSVLYNGIPQDPSQLYRAFANACVSGSVASTTISNRICDGVIHLRFRAFATNGFPLFSDGIHTNACFHTNSLSPGYNLVRQTQTIANPSYPDRWSGLYFWSNALPASMEMELGILEQPAWERYNSIPAPAARLTYLQRSDICSRVHLFRQRMPIRNIDPLAYQ